MLNLYSIFHLNLAYSSIAESQRPEVIKRCFWPLLRLATEDRVPIAIEAPGYTLEVVEDLEPSWIAELKRAIDLRSVEFIGSGYSQLIGPLVPASVNRWNLSLGIDVYGRLLSHVPKIWYVNEQAYSRGLVEHFIEIGARAIVMEWNNPRTLHPEWDSECRYHPQIAVGNNGANISVLWNDSIAFQKFQRYAHNEIGLEELISYITGHIGEKERYFCLYGNDAEIFDFRPGRFETEPQLGQAQEWLKIRELYKKLLVDDRFRPVFLRDVLDQTSMCGDKCSYLHLSLESAAQPMPVKKQPKYNATRWAVTGRNSLAMNSACYQTYQGIRFLADEAVFSSSGSDQIIKRLCYLWSSDFRTHIVEERWNNALRYLQETTEMIRNLSCSSEASQDHSERTVDVNGLCGSIHLRRQAETFGTNEMPARTSSEINQEGRFVSIRTPSVMLVLNRQKGLTIDRLIFPRIDPRPLAGTISHGYFEDISLSADWYSANTILQRPGRPQITDLRDTSPAFTFGTGDRGEWIKCTGIVSTEMGPIVKKVTIYSDLAQVDLDLTFDWPVIPLGSFRAGFVTLLPDAFDQASLFYATHNGGSAYEIFEMANKTIAHGAPGSNVVTASTGLGATEGIVVIGDHTKGLAVFFDQAVCAAMPMISFRPVYPTFFGRLMFSLGELDESRVQEVSGPINFSASLTGIEKERHLCRTDPARV